MTSDFYCDEVMSGRTAVEVVAETEDVIAFHHTRPYWPVHIVVVPKQHIPSLVDLGVEGEAILPKLLAVVRDVAATVTSTHGACRVLTNLGGYQDSKHLHVHVSYGEALEQPKQTNPVPQVQPWPTDRPSNFSWAQYQREVRKKSPRAYEQWSQEEDDALETMVNDEMPITEIAGLLGRQYGAIQSRIKHIFPDRE